MSDTTFRGEVALMRVMLRAAEKMVIVSKPVIDSSRYDLIVDQDRKLYRAQVKYANGKSFHSDGVINVRLGMRKRRGGEAVYTSDDVDVVIVFSPKTDKVYWLPSELWSGHHAICLRYEKPRNNQIKGCISAPDFEW